MRLGIGSYAYRWAVGTSTFQPKQPLLLPEMIMGTAALGCTLLQIADSEELVTMSRTQLKELRGLAADHNVHLQLGTSGATVDRLNTYLAIAIELKADVVRLVLHSPGIDPASDVVCKILTQSAQAYADAGVTIAVENHFLMPSQKLASLIEQVDSPAVGICLDTANSIICHEWPMQTISTLAPYVRNVHLKDYRLEPHPEGVGGRIVGAPLGDGLLDVNAVLAVLRGHDRGDLGVIIEQWCPLGSDEETTIRMETKWREQSFLFASQRLNAGDSGVRP